MPYSVTRLSLVWLLAMAALPAAAQDLALPEGSAAESRTDARVPRQGMRMESVESEFGAPLERRGPVGEPPIRVWAYPGFRVYFESGQVLHTVRDSDLRAVGFAAASSSVAD